MADSWFDVASIEHFWVRRRFEVLRRMLGQSYRPPGLVAEIGCGHGLVQAQFQAVFGVDVDGFELNEYALSRSLARDQPRFIYDIHDRNEGLRNKYALIILFDVIEHVENDAGFLESAAFHLAPGGRLAVNVPALEVLHSRYDEEQGHFRRYTLRQLENLGPPIDLRAVGATYWGMPLVPVLLARKWVLKFQKGERKVVQTGFVPPSGLVNRVLSGVSTLEFLPQCFAGTSAMVIFEKPQNE